MLGRGWQKRLAIDHSALTDQPDPILSLCCCASWLPIILCLYYSQPWHSFRPPTSRWDFFWEDIIDPGDEPGCPDAAAKGRMEVFRMAEWAADGSNRVLGTSVGRLVTGVDVCAAQPACRILLAS